MVGPRVYLVDCGTGVTRQLRRARLLTRLHEVFLTHLHSDHDCDYFNLFLLGWPVLQRNPPVHTYGPGSAGPMCAVPAGAGTPAVPLVAAANPTPGLVDVTAYHVQAHAYDINIRMRESGRSDLTELIVPHEIELPATLQALPPEQVAPPMGPVLVKEDDAVRITAVLVQHAPVFPAFAYRFDTDDGSVVLSGDTAPTPNLVTLAQGADILVHEVYEDSAHERNNEVPTWESERRRHHLVTSHTALSEVGQVAAAAEVGRLVLTHFIPGDDILPDQHWSEGVSPEFKGETIIGHDLLELRV